jgi:K+-transporting ATPase ATPase C chain
MQRIAQVRHLSVSQIQEIIDSNAKYPIFGFLGEARVNVLALNIALDKIKGN